MIVYFEAGNGHCGLREFRDMRSANRNLIKEVGTYIGITKIRKATEKDIAWVKGMGGYVPSK